MTIDAGNTAPYTAESIVRNVFLGNGVEIISIDYSGGDGAVGLFNNSQAAIGINRGIVLSTGPVRDIPKASSNTLNGNTSGETVTDNDLRDLTNTSKVVDIAKYEITFIPTSDTLRFRYVFASEEYPNEDRSDQGSVCDGANDAFGFFIKGPNPNGPDYNFENIALIPNPSSPGRFLNRPVTVNTVNHGETSVIDTMGSNCVLQYSQYYNQTQLNEAPIFNGVLDVFIAEALVVPCEEYTMKIAIGDGRDGNRDSAVFLEEKSFSTGSLEINVDNPGLDGGISEGCLPGGIIITLPRIATTDFPIEYEVIDDPTLNQIATPGVDYEIPTQDLFISAGFDFTRLVITPIDDNLEEGTEFIFLKIRRDICNIDTLIVPIFDNSLDFVDVPDSLFTCFGNQVKIETTIDDKVNITEAAVFRNSNDLRINDPDTLVSSFIEVTDIPQEFLNPKMIAEVCIDTLVHQRLNDLDIYLIAPSGQALELSTDNGRRDNNDMQVDTFLNTCFQVFAPSKIDLGNPVEGEMNLANPTYTGKYEPEGDWIKWLSPVLSKSNGTYELLIIDDAGEFQGELKSWSITFNATYEIDYEWSPREGLNCFGCESPTAIIEESQYYYLTLSDSYSCSKVDSVWIEVFEEPESPKLDCEALSPSEVRITWDDIDFVTSYEFRIDGNFPWIPANEGNSIKTYGFGIQTSSTSNDIIIQGLAPEESVEIILRGINESPTLLNGRCLGMNDTLSCMSLPCDNSSPVIDSIVIDQPSCDSQGGSYVRVYASDDDQPLIYRIYSQTFTIDDPDGEFLSLPQGNTPLRVIDNSGCVTLDTIRIQDPPPVDITAEIKNITCNNADDAFISLTVDSPSPPNTFMWSNGMESEIISDLSAGTYTVTVTDSDGCLNTGTYEIINPDPIEYSYIQIDTIDCLATTTGAATIHIEGGLAPYSTVWNNTILEDTISNQSIGSVFYTISDSLGCMIEDSALVVQRIGFDLDFTASDLTCFTDTTATATLTPSNGQAPYMYMWDNGQTIQNATELHAGINTVTITDQEGCEVIQDIDIFSPPPIVIDPTLAPTSCFGGNDGSISININGGIGSPYSLEWFNGSTTSSINDLSSGSYCVSVSDQNNCITEACIFLPDAELIEISPEIKKISCSGECDGAIILNPRGGTGNFNFNWSGPNNFSSSDESISDLCIGEYIVEVIEQADPTCSQTFNIDIVLDDELDMVIQPIKFISCFNGNDGILEAITIGGQEPFNYEWSGNATIVEDSITRDLTDGFYSVTVTDLNGCTNSASISFEQPDSLQAQFTTQDVVCFGDATGSTSIEIIGGTPDYLINWENGAISDTIKDLSAGNYVVTVTDNNGCKLVTSELIRQPESAIEIELNITEESCLNGQDGRVSINVINATDPIQYSLDNLSFKLDSTFSNLSSGDYTVYIVDGNNCTQQLDFTMEEGPELIVDLGPSPTVFFGESLTLSAQVENNQGDIFYEWSSGSPVTFSCTECPNPVINNITTSFGIMLAVTDENGCYGEDFLPVNVDDEKYVDVPTAFSPDGDGSNDRLHVFGDDNITIMSFKIYNRYGGLVYQDVNFKTNNLGIGWDGTIEGKEAPRDSYVWTLEYELLSGSIDFRSGQILLIR